MAALPAPRAAAGGGEGAASAGLRISTRWATNPLANLAFQALQGGLGKRGG